MSKLLIGFITIVAAGCSSSRQVTIVDDSGNPVSDAILRIDYPSFNGSFFEADEFGVVKYSKGAFDPVQVVVESPNEGSKIYSYPPPTRVTLDGKTVQY